MASGSVQLPMAHLSVRVPWHDTDWTGRICANPTLNNSCTILKNIKGRKNAEAEEESHGVPWAQLNESRVPPCAHERGGFMRNSEFTSVRTHPYARKESRSHGHFSPTQQRMPAYSLEATPFRWMMREHATSTAAKWNISYDHLLEEAADEVIGLQNARTWVQDRRNQLALLDSFFSAIRPGKSLVLIYAKDIPLIEERAPGTRILVGAGMVTSVSGHIPWETSGPGPLHSVMWERGVNHSIRSPSFKNGFLLPYQQLFANPELAGDDLAPFIARTPAEAFDEFSYVSELVSHDNALAALVELARVVELLHGKADGPWDVTASWISERIADAWSRRGAFPGLGSAMMAAGMTHGALIAHRVLGSDHRADANSWAVIQDAMAEAARGQGPAKGLAQRMTQKVWGQLQANPERFALLRMLSRFSLTADQARRLFDPEMRQLPGITVTDAELLANPYLIYEVDRGRPDAVSLSTIDRGMFPRDADAQAILLSDPLPEPVEEAVDDRRIRAACVSLLERAAIEGHTLLDEPQLRRRLAATALDPLCDPTTDVFQIAAEDFPPILRPTPLAGGTGQGWQLDRLATASDLITDEIARRVEADPIDVDEDWNALIDEAIEKPAAPGDLDEVAARKEKAAALRTLARSRISVLVGPAGTGKTTMLKALCLVPALKGRVLLLAPTGKARVQLGDKTGQKARTLAQYLRPFHRWSEESSNYRTNIEGRRDNYGYAAVVVDEASMLPEEALAALIATLGQVERLILCGDHRQLPPIGAGRPFADLVRHLREPDDDPIDTGETTTSAGEKGGGLAELTIGRRQRTSGLQPGSSSSRDDLAVASWFSVDGSHVAADEAVARVLDGRGDGTLTIRQWLTEDDLHRSIVECLSEAPELGLRRGDALALRQSFGAIKNGNQTTAFPIGKAGKGAEHWQLLSPVRAQPGGIAGLNRLVRQTWRPRALNRARRDKSLPKPMGADQILLYDKVMIGHNTTHPAEDTATRSKTGGELANGEIGIVVDSVGDKNKKPAGITVELSTQPGLAFTFWDRQLNGDKERGSETLELAYAITVHKSQGSQFGITFVVIPNPSPLLSPELLYTALTRHHGRCVLFVQGDPSELRRVAGPSQSDTARRLTRLFRAPDPFEAPNGRILDGSHVHRTLKGELVVSKSEVIVANILSGLGIEYAYERPLIMSDGTQRLPDFTITRLGQPPVYWEHLGKLDQHGYRADWDAKRHWYSTHGILPWLDGGGPAGTLVWSTERIGSKGIDSQKIEARAREVFGAPPMPQ